VHTDPTFGHDSYGYATCATPAPTACAPAPTMLVHADGTFGHEPCGYVTMRLTMRPWTTDGVARGYHALHIVRVSRTVHCMY
jgi:hypothetical protein